MTEPKILEIVDGPSKRELWTQARTIDNWVSPKEITQLPVVFQIGTKFSQTPFQIYIDEIITISNSENGIMFYGSTIEPTNGERKLVEGQYDFVEKTGIAWIKTLD